MEAVSLAAAILQLASFSKKVIGRSAEIYKSLDGSILQHQELALVAKNLRDYLSDVTTKNDDSVSLELKALATQGTAVTQELLDLLGALSKQRENKKAWHAVRQAFLTIIKENELQELERKVDNYRRQVDSALLHELYASTQGIQRELRLRSAATPGKDSVEGIVYTFLSSLNTRETATRPTEISLALASDLLAQVNNKTSEDKDEVLAQRIIEALWFTDIPSRYNAIPQAYETTFSWAFRKPQEHVVDQEWDDFAAWLISDQKLYWITGKPGSGKSTLMKYLHDRHETMDLFRQSPCVADSSISKAGFFFWNSGSELQMSIEGFLQSTLQQLCTGKPPELATIFPRRWKRCQLFGWDREGFTKAELEAALFELLSISQRSFLLFMDGLDEFLGDKNDVARLVMRLCANPNVKVCAASRPWVEFKSHFQGTPQLIMEKLTREDISRFVHGQLSTSAEFSSMLRYDPKNASMLTKGIVEKATGVFLWVYLVVQLLLTGMTEGDSMKDLSAHLNSLPAGLDELFGRILDQLDPRHEKEASELFQFVHHCSPEESTLIALNWLQTNLEDVKNAEIRRMTDQEVTYHAQVMQRRLLSRCKCFLLDEGKSANYDSRVTWVHRTARDYIEQPNVWKMIRHRSPNFNPTEALMLSLIRQAQTGRTSYGHFPPNTRVSDLVLNLIGKIEPLNNRIVMLDEMERAGSNLWSGHVGGQLRCYWYPTRSTTLHKSIRSGDSGNTSIFHVALAHQWFWYVQHRLTQDPKVADMWVTSSNEMDSLMFAILIKHWDMQFFLLQNGAKTRRKSGANCFDFQHGWTVWQILLKSITTFDHLECKSVPWDKVIRNVAAFINHGADIQASIGPQRTEKAIERILRHTGRFGTADEVRVVRKALSNSWFGKVNNGVSRFRSQKY